MPSLQPLAVLPASIDGHERVVIEDNTRIVATYARHTSIAILTSSPSDRELGLAPGWQKPSAGGHLHNQMIMEYESGWRDLIVMDREYRGRKAQLSRFVHDCGGMYLGTPLDESNCAHDRSLAIHLNNNLVLVIQRVRSSSDVDVIEIADRLDIAAIDAAAQRAGLSSDSPSRRSH